MSPVFADTRTVQGALVSIEQGYNPQIENPGDPWQRPMNYPLIWVNIARFFQLENETNFLLFVVSYVIAYVVGCLILLWMFPSFYMLLAMFSGALLLAVERGNNDLLVFVLMLAGVLISRVPHRLYARVPLFLSAAALKIYPAYAFLSLIKKNSAIRCLNADDYCLYSMERDHITIIQQGNTARGAVSYGLANAYQGISKSAPASGLDFVFMVLAVLASVGLLIFLLRNLRLSETEQFSYQGELMLTGASIYAFTYMTALNYGAIHRDRMDAIHCIHNSLCP